MGISLITCTGGRPEAFGLLQRWMFEQLLDEFPIEWIVVDDGEQESPLDETYSAAGGWMQMRVIRPEPRWRPGVGSTFRRNLQVGLMAAKYEKILFIEDDELYLPRYVSTVSAMLEDAQLAGQAPARYYNVKHRVFRMLPNHHHASLCQTGIRRELLPKMLALTAAQTNDFVDTQLWKANGHLALGSDVVSIKGMPGRPGIGAGHRPHGEWHSDPHLSQLIAWAGAERALLYSPYQYQ